MKMEFKGDKTKWHVGMPNRNFGPKVYNEEGGLIADCGRIPRWTLGQQLSHAKLISCAPEMLEALQKARLTIARLKRSMLAHPDCTEGSEFNDRADMAQRVEDEIEELIKKATTIEQ